MSHTRLHRALSEVFKKTPSTVKRAKVSGERKRKMLIAIGFAKARAKGVKLPKKKKNKKKR